MTPRYSRPEMTAVWSEENKLKIWLEIEILAAEAQGELGIIPKDVAVALRERGSINRERMRVIEQETRHETLAFLTHVAEEVGIEARFLHYGMTSSDVLDTALSVQLCQACDLILQDLGGLLQVLKSRANEHRDTLCIARTHGVHAEPTSFGLKLLGHWAAFERAKNRLALAREEIAICKLSGAVGNYANIDPRVESHVAKRLGLTPETISTQVVPRDRHAMFTAVLGIIAGSIENLATEIRHLQRTEVREVQEDFTKGQKGSSAMPHKKNPILSENLTGLARMIRAALTPAMENITLWHERDMSHSSVERVMLPDALILTDFALGRLHGLIQNLLIDEKRMMANLENLGGLYASQAALLELVNGGMSREEAYTLVQQTSLQIWQEGGHLKHHLTQFLTTEQLDQLFKPSRYLEHANLIFDRVNESF